MSRDKQQLEEANERYNNLYNPKKGEVFKHYKNDKCYKVKGIAMRECDLEIMVLYSSMEIDYPFLWTRPLKEWVEPMGEDGIRRFRFWSES